VPGVGGALVAQGLPVDQIGDLAFENGIRLHELAPAQASLEEAFMELTADSVEFHAHAPSQQDAAQAGSTDRMHPTGVA
jgi:ABC-2 type transport system ATP-binding protein